MMIIDILIFKDDSGMTLHPLPTLSVFRSKTVCPHIPDHDLTRGKATGHTSLDFYSRYCIAIELAHQHLLTK